MMSSGSGTGRVTGCTFLMLLFAISIATPVLAAQSTIVLSEGNACMGDDRSRKETEDAALKEAKRKAVESASTYIRSETRIRNSELEKDLLASYANATVSVQREIEKSWYQDPAAGSCCKVRIQAEVIPDQQAMESMAKGANDADDPNVPLHVKVWTERKEYRSGEKVRVFLRGNKPFHARVLYMDAGGGLVQLLPNPFRLDDYFNGGTVYEIPSGPDRFELEVTPPFGEEQIVVYASTASLGEIGLKESAGIFRVTTLPSETGIRTRGVRIQPRSNGGGSGAAEFFEGKMTITTGH